MKRYFGLTLLFLFTVMCTNGFAAQAVQITVGSGSAQPGQTINLPVTVDFPGEIAGAAFTLTYDKTKLTLDSITSTFFDTFSNQWNSLSPVPNPFPPVTVTVDSQTYTQPLIKNPVSGGMRISAARCKAGATNSTLFILSFTVGASVTPGQLTVNIIQTVLSNTNAGYSDSGEAIPILIGALEDPALPLKDSYPTLPSTVVSGKVTVNPIFVDSDGDGIDDAWEMAIFRDLTTANATSDYDKDGYSDLQEYLNIMAGLFDPSGNPYDLEIKNAPWGTGYKPPSVKCDFNGDGNPDILWRNTITGANSVWVINGAARTETVSLPSTSNQAWIIGGVGDFDGDGKPDILWRRTDTGANAVWFMDGTTVKGTATLPAESNLDWKIMNH